jgi:hypothetical protein
VELLVGGISESGKAGGWGLRVDEGGSTGGEIWRDARIVDESGKEEGHRGK